MAWVVFRRKASKTKIVDVLEGPMESVKDKYHSRAGVRYWVADASKGVDAERIPL